MSSTDKNPLQKIKVHRIIYPTLIGLGVVGYLLYKNFNPGAFSLVKFYLVVGFFPGDSPHHDVFSRFWVCSSDTYFNRE
jgi:hypothetical protein